MVASTYTPGPEIIAPLHHSNSPGVIKADCRCDFEVLPLPLFDSE
jgi:hypothetical protein